MGKLRPVLYFMYKKDLAKKYQVSTKTLKAWIDAMPALVDSLKYYGYDPQDKVFTPRQIELIFDYIGSPSDFPELDGRQRFPLRVYRKSELLDYYRTTHTTFNRYLNRFADLQDLVNIYKTKNYIAPSDVKKIFNWLGWLTY